MKKIKLSARSSKNGKQNGAEVIAWVNGHAICVGPFRRTELWRRNDEEDEMFISFVSKQKIELRDRSIELNVGELVVIPRGIEYRPVPYGEVEVLSF